MWLYLTDGTTQEVERGESVGHAPLSSRKGDFVIYDDHGAEIGRFNSVEVIGYKVVDKSRPSKRGDRSERSMARNDYATALSRAAALGRQALDHSKPVSTKAQ